MPADNAHGGFLRFVTSQTRPVSAACPPNLLHIPSSLFPKTAGYRYQVEIDARTIAPLAKGGWFCLWQNRGDSEALALHIGLCFAVVPAVQSLSHASGVPAPFDKGAFGCSIDTGHWRGSNDLLKIPVGNCHRGHPGDQKVKRAPWGSFYLFSSLGFLFPRPESQQRAPRIR